MSEPRENVQFSRLATINPHDSLIDKAVPFVGMEDVSEEGELLRLRKRGARDLTAGQPTFQDHDILFAKITPCMENGKGAYVNGLRGRVGIGSTEFHVIRSNESTSSRFLYHWTCSRILRQRAEAVMTGSAGQRRVPADFFDNFWVPSFPFPEQRRIADILDTLNQRIQNAEEAITKLSDIRDGLLHDLLSHEVNCNTRASLSYGSPSDEDDAQSASWKVASLGVHIRLQRGFDITQVVQEEGGVPVISSSGVSSYHDTAMVKGPGVVTGRKGKLGDTYFVREDFWPHDTTLWVSKFNGNNPQFVAYFLEWFRLERFDAATSVPTLNRNAVHPIPVAFPPKNEQHAIVDRIVAVELRIGWEQSTLDKLYVLKQGLMDDLLTGQVRVPAGKEDAVLGRAERSLA